MDLVIATGLSTQNWIKCYTDIGFDINSNHTAIICTTYSVEISHTGAWVFELQAQKIDNKISISVLKV